jgi:glycosyltransferase involved in cell wall biosynthesis
MKKLTTVVPVYNDDKYLCRCIDSLLNQSYKDLQIIIVNDASTDNTQNLIMEYQKNNSNIACYNHKQNFGTGAARNTGLQHCQSEYIAFLDSDDWLDTNTYTQMIQQLDHDKSDIGICGIKTEYESVYGTTMRYYYPYQNLIYGDFALNLLCRTNTQDISISPLVGNKIFRYKFLLKNKISYPQLSLFEDDYFMFIALLHASYVSIIPNVYHHYYQRETSAMHSMSKKQIDSLIDVFKKIRLELESAKSFGIKSKDYYSFLDKCLSVIFNIIYTCEQQMETQQKYIVYLAEQLLANFTVKELLENIEPSRIRHIWNQL